MELNITLSTQNLQMTNKNVEQDHSVVQAAKPDKVSLCP